MLAAEDDLVDSYARGELTIEERLRFEKKFLTSAHGRGRLQFARALAGVVREARSIEPASPSALHFRLFQGSRAALRIATVSAALLVVVVVSSLVLDRQRMSNELRNLRAQSVELWKQNQELQRAQQELQSTQYDQPKQREDDTTRTTRASKVARPKIAINHQSVTNTEDATLGVSFAPQRITQLPLNANNVASLLTLQPAATPSGSVSGARADQTKVALGGVVISNLPVLGRAFEDTLTLRTGIPTSISLPTSVSNEWIRLRLILDGAAQHTDYRATVQAADSSPVFSVDWVEPVTPQQTVIDTPVIPTTNLPSGDYRLLLLGKEPAGSFVRIADYAFKVVTKVSPGP